MRSALRGTLRPWAAAVLALWLVTIVSSCNSLYQPLRSLKVGLVAPFSGRDYDMGEDMLYGMKQAIAEWNQRGGVNGYAIELVAQDDRAAAEGGLLQARKMVMDKDVIGVIGHPSNPSALAALDVYYQAGLAMLVVGASAEALTAQGYPKAYVLNAQENGLAAAMANATKHTLKAERVALISQDGDYEGLLVALTKKLATQGLTVAGNLTLGFSSRDWQEAIATLTRDKPDLVVFSGTYVAGATFVSLLRQAGLSIPFLGGADLARPDFARLVGQTPGDIYYMTYTPEPPSSTPDRERFSQQFQAATGLSPRQTATLAYDATNLLLQALEEETQKGRVPTRQGVVRALHEAKTHVGMGGPVTFNDNGANTAASVFLYRVEGANYPGRLIAP